MILNHQTVEDLRRQHRDALSSLNVEQRRALGRESLARRRARVTGRWWTEELEKMFSEEVAVYHLNEELIVG